ncbi:MAG: electron transfer flavoprotein subunit beta/FixA family protein [Synergistaceae bacterium]|jgi:electron transfer flavoprotein beta subunit|nr:electron transfer flavoprotein subunit beta/FixA family protein [Synergistaceae bacterium]
MKIIVCAKQVPDTNEVKLDPKTGTLIREGIPSIINPDDRNALEEALRIKDKFENENERVEVVVLTMGPPQADVALREALAMGADRAILLCDRKFAGSDTWATAHAIAWTIDKIGGYDLVFCGRQAIDGDTAQVGPQVAEYLNLPQVTYVRRLDIERDGGTVTVERALEDGYEVIETRLPCLLTAVKELNVPRYPSMRGIFDAYGEKQVEVWSADDVGIDPSVIGLKASPTNVRRVFTPEPRGKGIMLEGSGKEAVQNLFAQLREKRIV